MRKCYFLQAEGALRGSVPSSGRSLGGGQGNGNGQGTGSGNGGGGGNGNGKPPPSPRRPCEIGTGPFLDNPGVEHRSKMAQSVLENLPKNCDKEDEISISFGNGKKKVFKKTKSTMAGLGRETAPASWSGMDENGSVFDYIRGKNGLLAGTYTDLETGNVYQFGTDSNGESFVRETLSNEFPDYGDHEDLDEYFHHHRMLNTVTSTNLHHDHTTSQQQQRSLAGVGDDEQIDVMVLWTKDAECRNAEAAVGCTVTQQTYDSMIATIELAIVQSNNAFIDSGIPQVQFNLVHAYREASYTEPTSYNTQVLDLIDKTDGKLDNVHDLRDEYGADVVAMITAHEEKCGVAPIGPYEPWMFSVTNYGCTTGQYAFAHEIG